MHVKSGAKLLLIMFDGCMLCCGWHVDLRMCRDAVNIESCPIHDGVMPRHARCMCDGAETDESVRCTELRTTDTFRAIRAIGLIFEKTCESEHCNMCVCICVLMCSIGDGL